LPSHPRRIHALLIAFLAIWFLYSGFIFWKRARRRRVHAIATGIWVLAVAGIAVACLVLPAARMAAQSVVAAVIDFRQRHGVYPPTDLAAGITPGSTADKWGIRYDIRNGVPEVFYFSTFQIFASYSYDFKSRTWMYYSD
jgi:hypothetical protein